MGIVKYKYVLLRNEMNRKIFMKKKFIVEDILIENMWFLLV